LGQIRLSYFHSIPLSPPASPLLGRGFFVTPQWFRTYDSLNIVTYLTK